MKDARIVTEYDPHEFVPRPYPQETELCDKCGGIQEATDGDILRIHISEREDIDRLKGMLRNIMEATDHTFGHEIPIVYGFSMDTRGNITIGNGEYQTHFGAGHDNNIYEAKKLIAALEIYIKMAKESRQS